MAGGGAQKAVLIACTYPGTRHMLHGPGADVDAMFELLIQLGFPAGNICVMRDDNAKMSESLPTKANIVRAAKWLVQGCSTGDSLVFHFSGHGTRHADLDGDERDGYDEAIVTHDMQHVLDDELHALLARPLAEGAVLHAVVDACHSGTALDLRYQSRWDKAARKFRWADEYSTATSTRVLSGSSGNAAYKNAARGPSAFGPVAIPDGIMKIKRKVQAPLLRSSAWREKGSMGLVIQFGAARDAELASDSFAGMRIGAATFTFVQCVRAMLARPHSCLTYGGLLEAMQEELVRVLGKPGVLSKLELGPWASLVLEQVGGLKVKLGLMLARRILGGTGQTAVLCCNRLMDMYRTPLLLGGCSSAGSRGGVQLEPQGHLEGEYGRPRFPAHT
jgi:hypothetical protein